MVINFVEGYDIGGGVRQAGCWDIFLRVLQQRDFIRCRPVLGAIPA